LGDALAIQEGRSEKTQAFQDPNFRGSWSGYERDCLFFNARGPRFYDAGHAFAIDFDDDGRAVVPVDIDGDGDLDLALLSLQGLRMMENRSPARRFARVRLEASKGDPQAIGALVVLRAGGVTQRDFVKITTGFATQCPLDLHFGLGSAEKIDEIEISWPDGSKEKHSGLPVDRRLVIRQGSAPRVEELPQWPAASRPRVDGRIKMKEIGTVPTVYLAGGVRLGAPPGNARVVELAPGDSLFKSLKADGPSVFVFDPEGRLRRAFYRSASDDEVSAVVGHLGKGKFNADLTSVATYHIARNEFDIADASLTRAVELEPGYPISHFYMGMLRGMQRRPGEAAESFRRAVKLDPYYRTAWHNLGAALFEARRFPEAADALREAIALGDNAETRHVLGSALASSQKWDDALVELKKSIELDARRAEAHGDVGKVLMVLGRKAEAESSFKKALEIDPNYAEARDNLKKLQGR
jgi:Tfp pilus assembly protein PilF